MNRTIETNRNETSTVAEDAEALLSATHDVAGNKVTEARERLAAALERSKEVCGKVREKVVEGAKVTDATVHTHPYQAIGIALGVGAFVGYLIGFRRSRKPD